MPLIIRLARGDQGGSPEIVIHSVGHDGMEINREFLSLAEAERHIVAVRNAIERCRAGRAVDQGGPPVAGRATPPAVGRGRDRRAIGDWPAMTAGDRPGGGAARAVAALERIRASGRGPRPSPPLANCPGS